MTKQNNTFSSNIGAILAAVGSAVGLGNIWRFPYICGKNGGGAFLIVYLLFVFGIGMMLLMTDFAIGRRSRHAPVKAFATLVPEHSGWKWVGGLSIVTLLVIISLYNLVSGWTTHYLYASTTGALSALGNDAGAYTQYFNDFTTSVSGPAISLIIFAVATALVLLGGVQKGIENVSKMLMPLLMILIVVMCVRSLTLPNAERGLDFLFTPRFSELTINGVMEALSQALFSLSVGMGGMIVYGSYLPERDDLLKTSIWITVCDTLIAVLSGVAIFPAVFSCGFDPAGGPQLSFCVLPQLFNTMGGAGQIFATIFFLLLLIAALTSAISVVESIVAWRIDSHNAPRWRATAVIAAIGIVLSLLLSLTQGPLADVRVWGTDLFNLITENILTGILIPTTALMIVVYAAWVLPNKDLRDELSSHGTIGTRYYPVYRFIIKYIAPVALITIIITNII